MIIDAIFYASHHLFRSHSAQYGLRLSGNMEFVNTSTFIVQRFVYGIAQMRGRMLENVGVKSIAAVRTVIAQSS
jgi:hypothetical protein